VLDALLEGGGAVGARDANKWGLAHYASWHGNTAAVAVLVKRGACLNLKDRWNE
jgi:ankyrin repeat protein